MQYYERTSNRTKGHTTHSTTQELPTGQRGIPYTALHQNFQLDKQSYHTQHYMRTSNRTKRHTACTTTQELPIGQNRTTQHYVRTSNRAKRHTTCTTTQELPIGQRIISHAALTFGAPDTSRVGRIRQQVDPPVNGDVFGGGWLVLLHMHDSYYSIV